MKYGVWITRSRNYQELEAEDEAEARRQYVQLVRDNLEAEHLEVEEVEENEGEPT